MFVTECRDSRRQQEGNKKKVLLQSSAFNKRLGPCGMDQNYQPFYQEIGAQQHGSEVPPTHGPNDMRHNYYHQHFEQEIRTPQNEITQTTKTAFLSTPIQRLASLMLLTKDS